MLYQSKLIRISSLLAILMVSGSTVSHGMEAATTPQSSQASPKPCVLPKRQLGVGEIPSGYVHCPIAQQLKFYRENVYDVALKEYGGNVEDLKVKPIPGLSLVLENAFALVNDIIQRDTNKTQEDKDQYVKALADVWRQAASLEGKLTSSLFQKYNQCIAYIIEYYNEKRNIDEDEINIKNISGINNIVFIVYGNPNAASKRLISPFHFVEQYCAEPYSAYIAFFDVLSVKKEEGTKKDPHWSLENGTMKMLVHDFGHIITQISNLKPPAKLYAQNILSIQKGYKERGDNNAATILMDGLFILLHEKTDVLRNAISINKGKSTDVVINEAMDGLKSLMIGMTNRTYGKSMYKKEFRDWEFILKDKYVDQDGQLKPVHDGEGKTFLPIEYDPAAGKMTRPFAGEIDQADRNEKMKMALADGYRRFWGYFLSLIQNAPNEVRD